MNSLVYHVSGNYLIEAVDAIAFHDAIKIGMRHVL